MLVNSQIESNIISRFSRALQMFGTHIFPSCDVPDQNEKAQTLQKWKQ